MADETSNKEKHGLTYRDAGVDIDAQDQALRRMKDLLRATRTPGVLSELGSFGGLFQPDLSAMTAPVLVSSCDGVGTKLRVAFQAGIHDTVGRDLVNHCVNDILVQGARPLFFMDYVATGRLDPRVLVEVVSGIARGCQENHCALLGGETAEMPGFYGDGEYDVAGFVVGLADRATLLDGGRVVAGDLLLALPSAGLHTNGYSLARKIFFESAGLGIHDTVPELNGTVAEMLLAEHRSYLGLLQGPLSDGLLHALAHITGGGLTDNLPRVLPAGLGARIRRGSWPVPPLFDYLQRTGDVATPEMYRAFNMGVGMVAVGTPADIAALERHLEDLGQRAYPIGEVVAGAGGVTYV